MRGGVGVGIGIGIADDKGPEVGVVLLGWLGAKTKHLKMYVSLYNVRDVHAVTFVDLVTDVVWFDLGRRVEERIERLTDDQDMNFWFQCGFIVALLPKKVWAAGFSTASLKRSISSSSNPSTGEGAESTIGIKRTNMEEKKPFPLETLLLSALEKFFAFLLHLPHVYDMIRD